MIRESLTTITALQAMRVCLPTLHVERTEPFDLLSARDRIPDRLGQGNRKDGTFLCESRRLK